MDLCGYPAAEEEVLSRKDTIRLFHEKRDSLNAKTDLPRSKNCRDN